MSEFEWIEDENFSNNFENYCSTCGARTSERIDLCLNRLPCLSFLWRATNFQQRVINIWSPLEPLSSLSCFLKKKLLWFRCCNMFGGGCPFLVAPPHKSGATYLVTMVYVYCLVWRFWSTRALTDTVFPRGGGANPKTAWKSLNFGLGAIHNPPNIFNTNT